MSERDLRIREQHFPGAESLVIDTRRKGFVPLPIVLRKLFRHLQQPELRVLIYLSLRASQYGICYPSYDEMIHELGLASKKNLEPHLTALVKKRFISRTASAGRHYFLVHDPRIPIQHLLATGAISRHELAEINELLADLRQEPIEADAALPSVSQGGVENVAQAVQ